MLLLRSGRSTDVVVLVVNVYADAVARMAIKPCLSLLLVTGSRRDMTGGVTSVVFGAGTWSVSARTGQERRGHRDTVFLCSLHFTSTRARLPPARPRDSVLVIQPQNLGLH
jgi:hypothetical protein